MKNNIFLEQSRRGYTREAQLTPYKAGGRSVGMITVVLLVLSVLAIAGVNYTPETEGFNAKIVFKGSKFTFYKDGEKVTSGSYRIDVSDCPEVLTECGNATSCVLHLPEEQCEKIAKATDGKIVVVPSGSAVINSFSNEVSLTLWDNMIDGFSSAFVKKN